ncbi:MAG: hypothetical protein A2521_00270 [Deltaproteobacteria bacterium RIFOXYD12_FULL_57_12]|nr:MAG: hypothetical protein A2521_00270 [Deltaproteobacteria bacterium RIFOXYD12_FULL_57_12]
MAFTYDDLHKKTVAELRDIAKDIEHEAVQGYTQLNKEKLLLAMCTALGIEARRKKGSAAGAATTLKARIKGKKAERDTAIEAQDHRRLRQIRRKIRNLKRKTRRAAEAAATAA